MKKLFAILLIGLLSILTFSSCVTRERCNEKYPCVQGVDSVKTVFVKETLRDTVIYTQPDVGSISALLQCDSLGQIYIRQIIDLKAICKSPNPTIRIRDNIIRVIVPVDSMAIYLTLKDRLTTTDIKTTIKQAPERINYLTGWQWFQIWWGRVLTILVVIALIWLILWLYKISKENDKY